MRLALQLFLCLRPHETPLLLLVIVSAWYAAHASNSGGTMLFLRRPLDRVTANLISPAPVFGNSDQSSAMAPVTKGAAALVPPKACSLPSALRLAMFTPGALSPCRPIDLPRFDSPNGLP